ncbi:MAG: hypothetical protein V4690_02890 [Patescibacteria group bacterium]
MSFSAQSNFWKKSLLSFFIISLLFSFAPKKVEAQYVDVFQAPKEGFGDFLAYTAAQIVLKMITAKTVNWINSGFQGNPSYVTDPKQFFLDVGDETASSFLSNTNLNRLCAPFKAEVRLALVKNYLSETSGENYSCSLSKIKANYEEFMNDFSKGGWDGWFEITQKSQNNPYGAYLDAKNSLSLRVSAAGEEKDKQIEQGGGFLSFQKCKKEYVITQAMLDGDDNSRGYYGNLLSAGYEVGDCYKDPNAKEVVTPGSVINGQLTKSLGSSWERLGAADEITEIVGALVGQLIERVVGGSGNGGGLRGTSQPGSTGNSFIDDFQNAPEPQPIRMPVNDPEDTFTCLTDPDTGVMRCRIGNEVPGTSGGQCADTGNKYASDLGSAMDAVLSENPDIADLPNIESGGRVNARRFLALVEEKLISRGFNATDEVLNGNNNPSTGDIIAVWRDGEEYMERYDAINGAAATIATAGQTNFEGFVPMDCTTAGGGDDCGCRESTGGPDEEDEDGGDDEETNPNPGTAFITSVSPSSAKPGATTITITGTDLTNQVSFFDGAGNRESVAGTVNSTKTQTTALVPTSIPVGNATVKVYIGRNPANEMVFSNGKLIQITNTPGGGGGGTATVPSYNASGGWGGNLAHNTTNNTWLVVSAGTSANGTYGKIMNNDGTSVGGQITITSGHSGGPKVAYSKDINKYLVVWLAWDDGDKTTTSNIMGRFINPDGTFSGSPFLVHSDTSYPNDSSMFYSNSPMQYDSKNKKFVYVWQTVKPGRHSNLRTISTTGEVGPRINLTSSLSTVAEDDGRGDPAVAIKESTNEYCVIYQRGYSTGTGASATWNPSIRARTVNALTGTVGPETVVYSESGANATVVMMSIVYNSVNNKYLVGWSGTNGAKGKFMTSCNGSVAGSTITLNSAASGHSLAYNPKSNQYASIGQNPHNAGNTFVILNSNGVKVSEGVAFAGGYGNFSPTIAANTTDGTFSATSAYEYGITRFAPNLGNAVASTQTISTPNYKDLGVGSFPDVVWFQNRLYVAFRSANNLAINLFSFDKNLGDQKTEKIFTLNSGAGGFPRLTVSSNTLWLAFRDGESSGEDIKLWKKSTDSIESLGPAVGNDPVAVGNGYIAWQKCEGTNCTDSKVYRRLLTGGSSTFIRNWLPTGIARISSTGVVTMIDTDRTALTWGLNSWYAGDLTVAADVTPHDDNGVVGRFNNSLSSEFNLWENQRTHTPHAATDGAGNYAVATWNPTVRVATFSKK